MKTLIYHVYPGDDLEEHDTSGAYCPCNPRIEEENGAVIIVHNSYDGREGLEMAMKILKESIEE